MTHLDLTICLNYVLLAEMICLLWVIYTGCKKLIKLLKETDEINEKIYLLLLEKIAILTSHETAPNAKNENI